MEALDLTVTKLRGPREQLGGLVFMARTVDKLRAEQPGGKIGVYLNRPDGLSAWLCNKSGISMDALRAVVANAANEDEIAAWVASKVTPEQAASLNAKIVTLGIDRLPPEFAALVRYAHPVMAQRPELTTFFDIFEADDLEWKPAPV